MMGNAWDADVAIGLDIAHKVVSSQFPRFETLDPVELGRGWDNICILYPDDTVFRLPIRTMGAELVAIERAVLPKIRRQVPMPVPDLTYFGEPDASYPYPFVGYPLLAGETADRLDWPESQLQACIEPLADFLRQLHSLPKLGLLPDDTISRTDPAALSRRITQRHAQARLGSGRADRLLAWVAETAPKIKPTGLKCVCHGDLYNRHILADRTLRISGVIDWGDVHWGHPAGDLVVAYTFFPPRMRPQFFETYGPVSEDDRTLAELRAANYGVALSAYGADVGDDVVRALGLKIIDGLGI